MTAHKLIKFSPDAALYEPFCLLGLVILVLLGAEISMQPNRSRIRKSPLTDLAPKRRTGIA